MSGGHEDDDGSPLIGIGRANGRAEEQDRVAGALLGLLRVTEETRAEHRSAGRQLEALACGIRASALREALALVTS